MAFVEQETLRILKPKYPWTLRYGVAVLTSIAAFTLTNLLWFHIEPALYPFFLGAVMVSSWFGGLGPGLVSTILGAYFSEYFFLPPIHASGLHWENLGRVAYFVSVAILICTLNTLVRQAQRRAEIHALEAQRNEALLRKSQTELQQSEARYRLLVDGITDYAIFMLSSTGQILSWTIGAERILGYQQAEIIGQPFAKIFSEEAIQQGLPERVLKAAVTQGISKENRWHIRKDGTQFWANCAIAPLWDEAQNLCGFSKIMQDITAQKQAEEERSRLLEREQAARQEAEAANQSKDEFLAILSHELRTPLAAITGWVGMLQSGKLDSIKTILALETIERNATLQMQLIEDLLDISRIIRGDLWLDRSPVNLIEVVHEAIATLQPQAEAKDIRLTFELDSSIKTLWIESDRSLAAQHPSVCVLGDAERLQQIVWNLLSNAIKFTPEGGRVAVGLTMDSQGDKIRAGLCITRHVTLQVRDTGIGIRADFLPYVFDRFRQADSSSTRSHKGLGLGLAIVKYLVEQQGGQIEARSPGEGQGATFLVTLPLLESLPDGIAQGQSLNVLSTLPFHDLPILIVDDESDTRTWLTSVFQMYDAQVVAVSSVDEALTQLQHFTPRIVVSDIAMPEKDGYVLIRALRERETETGITILAIALSAYADPDNIERSLAAGFQCHLAKPIKADKLLTVITNLIGPQDNRENSPL